MTKSLVIVESPAKAKTIEKYLGKGFEVLASVGHIMDLPKNEIGVELEKRTFEPTLIVSPGKEKVVGQLKKAAAKADEIFLAPDPDREGEAIAYHLALQLGTSAKEKKKIRRVTFNEITKKAVQDAFAHARDLDQNLVDAQQTRRVLDRLVGYQISPLLWDKVRRGLSAGRVQTVAVRLIVEREREIGAFVPVEYWTLDAELHPEKRAKDSFKSRFIGIDGEPARVSNGKDKEGKDQFIANALPDQEDDGRSGGGPPGCRSGRWCPCSRASSSADPMRRSSPASCSAMRPASWDSTYAAPWAWRSASMKAWTSARTDQPASSPICVPIRRVSRPKPSPGRASGSESSWASSICRIHPTSTRARRTRRMRTKPFAPPTLRARRNRLRSIVSDEQLKLYRLIWQRFVASQMTPAVFDVTTAKIAAVSRTSGKTYDFRTSGSVVRFDGFLKLYEIAEDKNSDDEDESKNKLPNLDGVSTLELEKLDNEQHFTTPPPRYNEASLVKVLEERGIGRPSTYASIINTIQDREYVTKITGRFYPTEIGMVVCDLLVKNFPYIFDTTYTARLEEELDDIEEGKEKWTDLLNGFYDHFEEELVVADKNMEDIKRMEVRTNEKCDLCGSPLLLEVGQVRQLLCVFGVQQEGPQQLHLHQGEHGQQARPEHAGSAGSRRAGRVLRELRQGDGPAARAVRHVHVVSRLQRRPAVQDVPQTEPEAAAEAVGAPAHRRRLPAVRQAAGAAPGRLRRVRFLLRISQVQVRQAESH